jgi:hypothetical protein
MPATNSYLINKTKNLSVVSCGLLNTSSSTAKSLLKTVIKHVIIQNFHFMRGIEK